MLELHYSCCLCNKKLKVALEILTEKILSNRIKKYTILNIDFFKKIELNIKLYLNQQYSLEKRKA